MSDLLVTTAIGSIADILWDFVEIKDVLNVSVCSRSFAQLPVPANNLNRLVENNNSANSLAQMKLTFGHDLTTGLVRRVYTRIKTSQEAIITIDERTGRIVLDIGSAFNNNNAFLAHDVTPVPAKAAVVAPEASPADEAHQQIVKELEISSYDEYDDFNPRHPMMKDRAHRRGDSLFNSDIDTVTSELNNMSMSRGSGSLGFDLSTIAAKAAQEDAISRETRTGISVKERMMAKKRGTAGLPPTGRVPPPSDN